MTDRVELFTITLSAEGEDLVATITYKTPILPMVPELEKIVNKHVTDMVTEIKVKELLG